MNSFSSFQQLASISRAAAQQQQIDEKTLRLPSGIRLFSERGDRRATAGESDAHNALPSGRRVMSIHSIASPPLPSPLVVQSHALHQDVACAVPAYPPSQHSSSIQLVKVTYLIVEECLRACLIASSV